MPSDVPLTIEQKRALARDLIRRTQPGAPAPTVVEHASPSLEAIGEEFYKPEQFPVYKNLLAQEAVMKQLGVKNPYFNCHTDVSRNTVTIDGQTYINYCGYNYLGLSGDPEVNAAVIDAVERYGTSVSASRIVSGEIPLHRELEAELAAFHRVEDAVVFVSGYGTNVSTIGHLFGPKDLLLHDSLIHNSAMTGCILSGARRMPFPHNDYEALERLLREHRTQSRARLHPERGRVQHGRRHSRPAAPDRDQGAGTSRCSWSTRRIRWARSAPPAAASPNTAISIRRVSISGWAR